MPGALILIVEDNPKNLKLIRDVLQFRGYATLEAETGEAGVTLALARQHQLSGYDAAYLELAMRRGAGLASLDGALRVVAKAHNLSVLPEKIVE